MRGRKVVAVTLVTLAACSGTALAIELNPLESLGKKIFFDRGLSSPPGQACAACHAPQVGFTGPKPGINKRLAVYPGAIHRRFGNRKPPAAAYAGDSPPFSLDPATGLFSGGMFWDGRATGEVTGDPLADQAMGPFLNPVEQNMADMAAVCEEIAASSYAGLFEQVWGDGALDCGAAGVEETYRNIARSIAAYERSAEVNPFSSKFDAYLEGKVRLSREEEWGMELFNGKAQCAACHPAPLFTDFTYDNLGVPRNPDNPFYRMDSVYLDDGTPINPLGEDWVDPGLGGFLATRPEYAALAAGNLGKHKVPTLRNVALAPGRGFTKAYMHNGVFKSLEEVVHFYNTRDVAAWPPPEVAENVNVDELGDLGLTAREEKALVAFLATLSDGYTAPKRR